MIGFAFKIANEAHDGQMYGKEMPYIEHPLQAAELAAEHGYPEGVVVGCLLHDVIEDTDITADGLRAYGFPEYIVRAVEAVTYLDIDEQSGVDKIAKAKSDILGHAIKFCDASVNLAMSKKGYKERKIFKYQDYVDRLIVDLPTPEDISDYVVSQKY